MKPHLHALFLAAFTTVASLHAAEKQKSGDVNSYPFWTGGKRGAATQFVLGLNAALQLSDTQKQQITATRDEVMNQEPVKAARGLSKSDPGVTAEQRENARATIDESTARLRERVTAVLTPEQKALIEKINAAYAAAVEEAGIVYTDKFASPSVKADPAARQRLQQEKNHDTEELFLQKLDDVLSPAQREAMKQAAEEEAQRAAGAGGAKKAVKQ